MQQQSGLSKSEQAEYKVKIIHSAKLIALRTEIH